VCDYYTFLPGVPFDSAFSAPYLVSLIFHGVPIGPDWQSEKPLKDESILSLAKKVHISEWDEASRLYPLVNRELMSRVRVITLKGEVFEQEIRIPKGDPRKPLSENELRLKFFNIGESVLGSTKTEALYDIVINNLENVDDIKNLAEIMRN
jgi:2-methylcitrate dehydratase